MNNGGWGESTVMVGCPEEMFGPPVFNDLLASDEAAGIEIPNEQAVHSLRCLVGKGESYLDAWVSPLRCSVAQKERGVQRPV